MFVKKYTYLLTLALSLITPFKAYSAQASTEKPEVNQNNIEQLKAMIVRRNDIQLSTSLKYEEFQNAFATFINKQDENGQTLLHKEAPKKEINLAQLFITHGAAINIQDNDGNTPLHCAVKKENSGLVELLINAGANKKLKNKNDETPLIIAEKTRVFTENSTNSQTIIALLDGSYKDPFLDFDSDDTLEAAVNALSLTKH